MLTCAFCVNTAFGQQNPVVFQADANLQTLAVRVTDKQGHNVGGLSADDFVVLEDGRPQKIAFFGTETQPVSLAVLLDSSSSMKSSHKLGQVRALLGPLLRGHLPEDEISFEPFTDRVESFRELTSEERMNPPPIQAGAAARVGTALYDALATSLCHLRTARNVRQAVVVITDGADQHSRLEIAQLIRLAQVSRAQIFMIGFFDPQEAARYRLGEKKLTLVNGHQIDNPIGVFKRIANESGAESFFPSSERDLKQALNRILGLLNAEYTLAYVPASLDRFRGVQVKVNRAGLNVLSRRRLGLEASEGEPVGFEASSCLVSASEHPYPWEPMVTKNSDGSLVYRDDFSDPRTGWPGREGYRYLAGAYEMGNSAAISPFAEGTIVTNGPMWSNFDASLVVTGNALAAGMVFRLNEAGCYLLLLSHPNPSRPKLLAYKLVKRDFGARQEKVIVPWMVLDNAAITAKGNVADLRVQCKGNRIQVLVDEVPQASIVDNSFADGYVGLAQYGAGRAQFRDLRVTELP